MARFAANAPLILDISLPPLQTSQVELRRCGSLPKFSVSFANLFRNRPPGGATAPSPLAVTMTAVLQRGQQTRVPVVWWRLSAPLVAPSPRQAGQKAWKHGNTFGGGSCVSGLSQSWQTDSASAMVCWSLVCADALAKSTNGLMRCSLFCVAFPFAALTLLVGRRERHPVR